MEKKNSKALVERLLIHSKLKQLSKKSNIWKILISISINN